MIFIEECSGACGKMGGGVCKLPVGVWCVLLSCKRQVPKIQTWEQKLPTTTPTPASAYCKNRHGGQSMSITAPSHTSCCCSYENIVQIRCLLEGDSVQDILDHWHVMLQERMQHWGLERSQVTTS